MIGQAVGWGQFTGFYALPKCSAHRIKAISPAIGFAQPAVHWPKALRYKAFRFFQIYGMFIARIPCYNDGK